MFNAIPTRWLISATLGLLLQGAQAIAAPPPSVTVAEGAVQGVRQGRVDAFLGIPFAAPPVGENRFRAPQPATPWLGTRHADQYGANCIQPPGQGAVGPWTHEYVVTENFSEDCLFLNVWRPASISAEAKLPVFVWIHGGGFTSGSGAVPIYNGRHLATNDIIVVTLNYRVGPLGFLALPDITREAGDGAVSNFGIQDQIAALRWLQQNIGAFGGDADRVTIAGQSAGSMAVHTLVASPMAKGLFHQAIAQAGLPARGTAPDLATAEQNGLSYMEQLGVSSLAQMRALTAESFLPDPDKPRLPFRFSVTVDGNLLPDGPAEMVFSGRANDVPMIIGRNADENLGFAPVSNTATTEEWLEILSGAFKKDAETFAPFYRGDSDTARATALKQLRQDRGVAAMWLWGMERAARNDSDVYLYVFDHVEPGPDAEQWGSFHSNELPYIFGTLDTSPERGFSFADWRVSLTISQLWSNFVKTGKPSAAGSDAWPAFNARKPRIMRISEIARGAPLMDSDRRAAYQRYAEQGGELSRF